MADEGNALGRVNPGDPLRFPAQTFNIFCDTAEAVARMRGQFAAGGPASRNLNMDVVTVRNDTGGDLDRFSVVGLGEPIIDNAANEAEFKNRVTFKAVAPDIDLHRAKFAILVEPIGDGRIGRAVVSGVCQVRIDVDSAAHKYADIADGETGALKSGDEGSAQILWKDTGTGDGKWAIVRLGPPSAPTPQARWIRFVLTAEPLYTSLTAAANVLEYWDGSDPDPDDEGLEVRNCAVSGDRYMFRGDEGAIGLACYNPEYNRYHIVQLECP